jgi:hypothetical protein
VRISRTTRPHLLHANAYGTYPAGSTFGPSRRTRSALIALKCRIATAYSIVPSRSPFVSEQILRTTRAVRPSPCRIVPASGPATNGRLYHLVLAFPMLETLQMAGPLRSADITPLHRYYGPSRHPLVFGRLPGFAGYTAYLAPTISRRDEEGFSSCLACPCHRAVAFTPPR